MKFLHKLHPSKVLPLIIVISLAFATAITQTPSTANEAEAQKHLLKLVDPVYPAIAKAAHVQGNVVLQLEIGKDGHVTKVKSLSGPPMLVGAATDAAKQWQYKPFEESGSPVSVSIKVTVPFTLPEPIDPNDEEIAKTYFPLSMHCVQLVTRRADPAEQAMACQKAAEQADLFAKASRFIERRSAYVYYTTALIRNGRAKEAVTVGEKAIAVVMQGHDDASGSSAAYSVTAQAKALSGDLVAADKDCEIAERYQRQALDSPAGHELNKSYSQTLKSLLSFHAQVLAAMGKQSDAQAKLDQANKL